MASPPQHRQIIFESNFMRFRLYSDGTCDRFGEVFPPPSFDPSTDVSSKDVSITIQPDSNNSLNISARLYLPKASQPNTKLPILLYFHGGGFVIETPFSPHYHPYLNALSSRAGVLAVSVHYRRVPEHPLSACYDDCYGALKWVFSHSGSTGPDAWLNDHADIRHVFLMGDSAGANIAHHVAIRAGLPLEGVVLVHPFFWGKERAAKDEDVKGGEAAKWVDEMWSVACPAGSGMGSDHPWINVVKAGGLEGLGCRRVLVCVGEKDVLRGKGWEYQEALRGSGWEGEVEEVWEAPEEGHVFHLFKPACELADVTMDRVASFLNCCVVP